MTWQRKEHTPHLVDHVGNLLQDGGGIVPKACQKCKTAFDAPVQVVELKETVPMYKCDSCLFINSSADYAWDHEKANLGHKVGKTVDERIIGVKSIIVGNKSHVVFTEGELPMVLCGGCLNG